MSDIEKQRVYERLSAYIDGASDAPDEVARLIETDPEAARLFAELSRLSAGLRSLPAPDVHPAFATRVMAHVREVRDAEAAAPQWRHVVQKILGAAAAVVLIAIAVWPFRPGSGITTPTVNDPIAAEVLRLRNQPDTALTSLFGALEPSPEDETDWAGAGDVSNSLALLANPPVDAEVAAVAGRVADAIGGPAPDDEDVFATLDSLNEHQAEALRALLADYAEGGSELL